MVGPFHRSWVCEAGCRPGSTTAGREAVPQIAKPLGRLEIPPAHPVLSRVQFRLGQSRATSPRIEEFSARTALERTILKESICSRIRMPSLITSGDAFSESIRVAVVSTIYVAWTDGTWMQRSQRKSRLLNVWACNSQCSSPTSSTTSNQVILVTPVRTTWGWRAEQTSAKSLRPYLTRGKLSGDCEFTSKPTRFINHLKRAESYSALFYLRVGWPSRNSRPQLRTINKCIGDCGLFSDPLYLVRTWGWRSRFYEKFEWVSDSAEARFFLRSDLWFARNSQMPDLAAGLRQTVLSA